MPFDVGLSINNATTGLLKNATIKAIAENPIYTAIIIVLVVMMVVLVVFRNSENDNPLPVMTLRTGFWCFIGISVIMLMHNKVLSEQAATVTLPDLFTGAPISGEYESLVVPII